MRRLSSSPAMPPRSGLSTLLALLALWALPACATSSPGARSLPIASAASANPDAPSLQDPQGPPPQPRHADYEQPLPANSVELAVGTDAFHVNYRGLLHPGGGYGQLEWLSDNEEHTALNARLMRFSARDAAFPQTFGVGIGAHAAFDRETDLDAYGFSLIGSVYYDFDTDVPTNIALDLAYAPDITTFADGDSIFDAQISFGVDISPWASTFLGYRHLSVDYETGAELDLADQVMLGVRLAW